MTINPDSSKPVQQVGDQSANTDVEDDIMDVDINAATADKNTQQTTESITDIPREDAPPAEQQAEIIAQLYEQHSRVGQDETWFIVNSKWLRAYRAFANLDDNWRVEATKKNADTPTPIDNEPIIVSSSTPSTDPYLTKLRPTVMEPLDYELVPQPVFNKLFAWYGGGPIVARRTYSDGPHYNVDVMPYFVQVAYFSKSTDMTKSPLQFQEIAVSKKILMKDLKAKIKKHFAVIAPDNELRLYSALNGSPYQRYESEEMASQVQDVIERPRGQQIILEEKSASGWRIKSSDEDDETAPITAKSNGAAVNSIVEKRSSSNSSSGGGSSSSSYGSYTSNNGDNVTSEPGVCGLQNLGNTCFMNSALQCLTKTPVIRDFFTQGDYINEINRDNPLGMGGKIAEAFGNLMKDMFSGRHSYISPREFKHVIGKFAPQFSGYQQQDSQELIAYLLDGLHEDLNRIKKKPVTEAVESKGRSDNIVANEAWEVHKQRNDSVIVDRFQGQLKSELVCPDCGNVSITFDPFMYLSLPLPVERNRFIEVLVVFYGNRRPPMKCQVNVSKRGNIDELRKAVADVAGIAKPQYLVIAEVFHNKIYRYYSDTMETKNIQESDIIMVYELSDKLEVDEKIHTTYGMYDNANLPFAAVRMCTTVKEEPQQRSYNSYSSSSSNTRTAYLTQPFVIPFSKKDSTNKEIYEYCLDYLRPYLRPDVLAEHNIAIDQPETVLYKGPTEKQRLKIEAERERQKKQREKEERERQKRYRYRNHNDSDDSDKMSEEDENVEPQQQDQQQQDDDDADDGQPGLILFGLRFEDTSYSSSRIDAYEDVLPYNDNIVEIPRNAYYSSSYSSNDKKSILMNIDAPVLENLIDQQKLKEVEIHDSAKPTPTSAGVDKKKGVSLDSCLELFTSREKLSSNDTWYCPECKNHVEATKKFDLWRLPEVLVVHLKRFQFNRYTRDKIETFVDYPISGLDLSQHVHHNLAGNKFREYDLFAVSNHYGGLGGGHYTAFAKIQRKNQWFKFDDSFTSPVNESEVKASSGYVLFYIARPNNNDDNTTATGGADDNAAATGGEANNAMEA